MNTSWVSSPGSGHTHLNPGLLTPVQCPFPYTHNFVSCFGNTCDSSIKLFGNIFKHFDEVVETEFKSMSNEDHRKGKG